MAGRILPVNFIWCEVDVVGEHGVVERAAAMVPLRRFAGIVKRQYVLEEEYTLAPMETRSRASHNAYFAELNKAYDNLPEVLTARWKTSEHMRKWLLVEKGWYDEKEFDCPTKKFALQLGTFLRTEAEYARMSIHEPTPNPGEKQRYVLIVRVAKSQNAQSMGKEAFEASKKDVLDEMAHMIGVARADLRKNARSNA